MRGSRRSTPSSTSTLPARAPPRIGQRTLARGKPLSPIDGMPIGIKDVIETADMPTEMGSPLFDGWRSQKDAASVAALRAAGAIILGKTVTTEFAMSFPLGNTRNPHELVAHAGRLEQRHGGGGRRRSHQRRARHAGDRLDCCGRQVFAARSATSRRVHALNRTGSHDYQSQSCTGVIAATLEDTWQVAYEIAIARRRRSRLAGSAGPGRTAGGEKAAPRWPFSKQPDGPAPADDAKRRMGEALERIRAAGVEVLTRARPRHGRCGRTRYRRCHGAVDEFQRLGNALVHPLAAPTAMSDKLRSLCASALPWPKA